MRITVELLYNRLSPMIFSTALKLLGNRQDAEDIVHDIFAHKIPTLTEDGSLRTLEEWARFLTTAAKNQSIDVLRRGKRIVATSYEDALDSTQDSHGDNDTMLDLRRALSSLEFRYREVLSLKYLVGLTWEELASRIGLSQQGARKRAADALKKMRDCGGKDRV